ncbi:hypothetical protein D3C72_2033190 [compost metagenome]
MVRAARAALLWLRQYLLLGKHGRLPGRDDDLVARAGGAAEACEMLVLGIRGTHDELSVAALRIAA